MRRCQVTKVHLGKGGKCNVYQEFCLYRGNNKLFICTLIRFPQRRSQTGPIEASLDSGVGLHIIPTTQSIGCGIYTILVQNKTNILHANTLHLQSQWKDFVGFKSTCCMVDGRLIQTVNNGKIYEWFIGGFLLRQLYWLIYGSSTQLISICLNRMNAILYPRSVHVYIYPINTQA